MQKYFRLNPVDATYWEEKGWTKKISPWNQ